MARKKIKLMALTMGLCMAATGVTAHAASPTTTFNFKVTTSSNTGVASGNTATKTTTVDYATIKVTSISNTSYGVWLRADKGSVANGKNPGTSEQRFTGTGRKESNYRTGMKSVGSLYTTVGRLVPGAPNITVKGNMTP